MKNDTALVSIALVFKQDNGLEWFLVKKNPDSEWEFPRTDVRTGESSVRASIRTMAEDATIRAKVLEEVGRSGGATRVKGRLVSQRHLYYLMQYKDGGSQLLGFTAGEWVEHTKALKRLTSKRDNAMLKEAKKVLKTVDESRLVDEEEPAESVTE